MASRRDVAWALACLLESCVSILVIACYPPLVKILENSVVCVEWVFCRPGKFLKDCIAFLCFMKSNFGFNTMELRASGI